MINARLRALRYASAMIGEVSWRMVLPIPMKNLIEEISKQSHCAHELETNPNVAPDPAMYCPRDLITPFGPAP
jgi:hypothetical protein